MANSRFPSIGEASLANSALLLDNPKKSQTYILGRFVHIERDCQSSFGEDGSSLGAKPNILIPLIGAADSLNLAIETFAYIGPEKPQKSVSPTSHCTTTLAKSRTYLDEIVCRIIDKILCRNENLTGGERVRLQSYIT